MILYALLDVDFSLAMGLPVGGALDSVSGGAGVEGPVLIMIAGIFVGLLGQMLSSSPDSRVARILTAYSIADGICNATQDWST